MENKVFVKRRHHYVWAHYLRSWSVAGGVYYVSPKGRISQSNANGLSAEDGFYKISYLNDHDVKYLSGWIEKSDPKLKKIQNEFLSDFILRSRLLETANVSAGGELDPVSLAVQFNSLEDVYTGLEQDALNVINGLAGGKFELLDEGNNMLDFCCYVGHQLTRTKSFRERTLKAILSNLTDSPKDKFYAGLARKNWWYVNFLLGLNVGWSFYSSRDELHKVALVNDTKLPFITSDNPVVNVHSSVDLLKSGEVPEYMDLYIPISPKVAFMLNDSSDFNHLSNGVLESDVKIFNDRIAKGAYKSIYSNDGDVLSSLKWSPKQS